MSKARTTPRTTAAQGTGPRTDSRRPARRSGSADQPPAAGARRQPFVYGVVHDGLFVVARKAALDYARLNRALHTSETWGEVTAKAPRHLCREVREALDVQRIPGDRYVSDVLEDLADQNALPSLGKVMLASLPAELTGLVHHEYSAIGDELPSLSPDDLSRVLSVFRALGIPCVEDQALIVAACGYLTDDPEEMRS